MIGKEDGAVPKCGKSHLQYLQVIPLSREIPTAELVSHWLMSGEYPICGAALSGL